MAVSDRPSTKVERASPNFADFINTARNRQDTRTLLAKWVSPVDLTRHRSSATAANTGETP
jgi:hypothetical protein